MHCCVGVLSFEGGLPVWSAACSEHAVACMFQEWDGCAQTRRYVSVFALLRGSYQALSSGCFCPIVALYFDRD